MRLSFFGWLFISVAAQVCISDGAVAQSPVEEPNVVTVDGVAPSTPLTELSYKQMLLRELNPRIKRSRIALIVSGGTTALGTIFIGAGLSQCRTFAFNGSDDLLCNNTGDALLATGSTLFFVGAIGLVVNGIMLGVRKGKRRRLNRSIKQLSTGQVQWDPQRGAFVF